MKVYRIKILRTTPTHLEGSVITIDEFRYNYPTIINKDNSDAFVIRYLKGTIKDQFDIDLSTFFEVIESNLNDFGVGNWVWHNTLNVAYLVVHNADIISKNYRPNHVSLNVANAYTYLYTRLATEEEIKYSTLHEFDNSRVLIGRYKCYFYETDHWNEIVGIHHNLELYLKGFDKIHYTYKAGVSEPGFKVKPMGMKVGCVAFSDSDVRNIAELLDIHEVKQYKK